MAKQLLSFHHLLLVVFLLSVAAKGVHCFQEKKYYNLLSLQWQQHQSGELSSCLSQKSRSVKGATILEMKHRAYCSGKITNWNKKQQKLLALDVLHVKYLQSRIKTLHSVNKNGVSDTQIPLTSGIKLETLNYIVTVEVGGRKMTVIVDTGSDLTWVQCQPCKLCYNQQDPLFNPSVSPSYKQILCNSSTCKSLEVATGNSGVCGANPPTCNYYVIYGDGSYSRGELARESLNLGTTAVKDFVFGCGRNNRGLFGGASGLLGFGRSDISLVSQTSSIFGGLFSYCLPSTEAGASGSLILGRNYSVYRNSTPFSYTRMIPNPQLTTFYFLNLTSISIGGVALQDPGFGKFPGILIDSGTVISRLPPGIYRALKAEFSKQFSEYPSAPGYSILDTCYNLSSYEEVNVPIMKFQFEGNSALQVDVRGMFYFVKSDASQVCLALASLSFEDEIAIIGNYQQRNQRVIYDTKESKVGFAAETCSSM
ncbi:aspartyl protease family protein At5g10770 [Mangifera indica]|uniref:aspartyl protease family protein At5g10770 n=1 Tax=Mangifera indica TaxID=29780 RepID=UPI001CF9B7B6|nr:aspartyl protease family protein At5g10770 [Mangifera indica]